MFYKCSTEGALHNISSGLCISFDVRRHNNWRGFTKFVMIVLYCHDWIPLSWITWIYFVCHISKFEIYCLSWQYSLVGHYSKARWYVKMSLGTLLLLHLALWQHLTIVLAFISLCCRFEPTSIAHNYPIVFMLAAAQSVQTSITQHYVRLSQWNGYIVSTNSNQVQSGSIGDIFNATKCTKGALCLTGSARQCERQETI